MGVFRSWVQRWVALVVSFCFTVSLFPEAVHALPALEVSLKTETPRILNIDIPEELASVDEWYAAPAQPKPKLIVHIQDAHSNYEAQTHIRDLLKYLHKTYGFKTILAEGAAEQLDPKYLKLFPDKETNMKLMDELAKEGEVTGTEMVLMEDEKAMVAEGIEKPELYRRNFDALQKVYRNDSATQAFFESYEKKMGQIASRTFGPRMIQALTEWKKFEAGRREFLPFVTNLSHLAQQTLGIDLDKLYAQIDWPQLTRLLVLQRLEKELAKDGSAVGGRRLDTDSVPSRLGTPVSGLSPRDQAQIEQKQIIEFLIAKKASAGLIQGLEKFNDKSVNMNRMVASDAKSVELPRVLIELLAEEGGKLGLDLRNYPAFAKYAGYLIIRSEIIPGQLFEEIEKLFDQVLEGLVKQLPSIALGSEENQAQRDRLLRLYRDEVMAQKLLKLELSRTEWLAIIDHRDRFQPDDFMRRLFEADGRVGRIVQKESQSRQLLTESFQQAMEFYDAATSREDYFFQKMREVLQTTDKAILITGGFHAEGMKSLMREYDINYGVVTPRISKDFSNEVYRKVMMTGMEKAGGRRPEVRGIGEQTPASGYPGEAAGFSQGDAKAASGEVAKRSNDEHAFLNANEPRRLNREDEDQKPRRFKGDDMLPAALRSEARTTLNELEGPQRSEQREQFEFSIAKGLGFHDSHNVLEHGADLTIRTNRSEMRTTNLLSVLIILAVSATWAAFYLPGQVQFRQQHDMDSPLWMLFLVTAFGLLAFNHILSTSRRNRIEDQNDLRFADALQRLDHENMMDQRNAIPAIQAFLTGPSVLVFLNNYNSRVRKLVGLERDQLADLVKKAQSGSEQELVTTLKVLAETRNNRSINHQFIRFLNAQLIFREGAPLQYRGRDLILTRSETRVKVSYDESKNVGFKHTSGLLEFEAEPATDEGFATVQVGKLNEELEEGGLIFCNLLILWDAKRKRAATVHSGNSDNLDLLIIAVSKALEALSPKSSQDISAVILTPNNRGEDSEADDVGDLFELALSKLHITVTDRQWDKKWGRSVGDNKTNIVRVDPARGVISAWTPQKDKIKNAININKLNNKAKSDQGNNAFLHWVKGEPVYDRITKQVGKISKINWSAHQVTVQFPKKESTYSLTLAKKGLVFWPPVVREIVGEKIFDFIFKDEEMKSQVVATHVNEYYENHPIYSREHGEGLVVSIANGRMVIDWINPAFGGRRHQYEYDSVARNESFSPNPMKRSEMRKNQPHWVEKDRIVRDKNPYLRLKSDEIDVRIPRLYPSVKSGNFMQGQVLDGFSGARTPRNVAMFIAKKFRAKAELPKAEREFISNLFRKEGKLMPGYIMVTQNITEEGAGEWVRVRNKKNDGKGFRIRIRRDYKTFEGQTAAMDLIGDKEHRFKTEWNKKAARLLARYLNWYYSDTVNRSKEKRRETLVRLNAGIKALTIYIKNYLDQGDKNRSEPNQMGAANLEMLGIPFGLIDAFSDMQLPHESKQENQYIREALDILTQIVNQYQKPVAHSRQLEKKRSEFRIARFEPFHLSFLSFELFVAQIGTQSRNMIRNPVLQAVGAFTVISVGSILLGLAAAFYVPLGLGIAILVFQISSFELLFRTFVSAWIRMLNGDNSPANLASFRRAGTITKIRKVGGNVHQAQSRTAVPNKVDWQTVLQNPGKFKDDALLTAVQSSVQTLNPGKELVRSPENDVLIYARAQAVIRLSKNRFPGFEKWVDTALGDLRRLQATGSFNRDVIAGEILQLMIRNIRLSIAPAQTSTSDGASLRVKPTTAISRRIGEALTPQQREALSVYFATLNITMVVRGVPGWAVPIMITGFLPLSAAAADIARFAELFGSLNHSKTSAFDANELFSAASSKLSGKWIRVVKADRFQKEFFQIYRNFLLLNPNESIYLILIGAEDPEFMAEDMALIDVLKRFTPDNPNRFMMVFSSANGVNDAIKKIARHLTAKQTALLSFSEGIRITYVNASLEPIVESTDLTSMGSRLMILLTGTAVKLSQLWYGRGPGERDGDPTVEHAGGDRRFTRASLMKGMSEMIDMAYKAFAEFMRAA